MCGCECFIIITQNWERNGRRRRRKKKETWRLLSKPTDLILIHAYIMPQFNINNKIMVPETLFSPSRSLSLTIIPHTPFSTIYKCIFKYRLMEYFVFFRFLCVRFVNINHNLVIWALDRTPNAKMIKKMLFFSFKLLFSCSHALFAYEKYCAFVRS